MFLLNVAIVDFCLKLNCSIYDIFHYNLLMLFMADIYFYNLFSFIIATKDNYLILSFYNMTNYEY